MSYLLERLISYYDILCEADDRKLSGKQKLVIATAAGVGGAGGYAAGKKAGEGLSTLRNKPLVNKAHNKMWAELDRVKNGQGGTLDSFKKVSNDYDKAKALANKRFTRAGRIGKIAGAAALGLGSAALVKKEFDKYNNKRRRR